MAGGSTISMSDTRIDALKLQSSCYGAVIPLVYGLSQVAGNLLWYGGFQSISHTTSQGGKGGGVKQQNTTFTYAADVLMGLCHGPVTSVTQVWRGKSLYSGGATGGQIVTVTETFSAGAAGSTYTLGHSTTFVSFGEVTSPVTAADGTLSTATLQRGVDYSYANGIVTVANGKWNGASLSVRYQYRSSTIVTTALDALGLTFIKGELGQADWSGLASYGTQSIGYSGLCCVAATQYDLGTTATVDNHKFEVMGPWAYHLAPAVPDIDPSLMLRDVLSSARAGANFPGTMLDVWSSYSDYCVANNLLVSPCLDSQVKAADVVDQTMKLTNAATVWSGGRLKVVPYGDATVTMYGRTFTPNTTPVYDLNDDDFCPSDGEDPVRFTAKPSSDRYNQVQVEYLDRTMQYAPAIATAKDLTDISANGLRACDVIQAHWICDAQIARNVAQLVMQRSLYVLNTYKFKLPWHFALLEPMDLVTLTDPGLGMDHVPVRITTVTENEDGDLEFDAEDYPSGVCSAALYTQQSLGGFQHNYNADPGTAPAPFVFEAPAAKTSTGIALRVAVKASASADWGGAQVWISLDGTNYRMAGTVFAAARTGKVATAATSGSTSFAVNGLTGQLQSGSAADAAALSTLCYIGGANPEYFAYQTATLTGAGAYTLAGLVRQAYGTPAGAHAVNDPFVRVDSAVVQFEDLDVSMVGKTVYIKVLSFNRYQMKLQGLADVTASTYVITGNMAQYLPGVGGKGLLVNASGTTLRISAAGVATPTSVTLTAVRTGILSGTVTWSVLSGTATLSVSGDTCTVTAANMSTDTIVVRASITDPVHTYVDDTTISKVYDSPGATARINASLGNQYASGAATPNTATAYAGIRFGTDGHIYLRQGGTTSTYVQQPDLWCLDGTPAATFKIRFSLVAQSSAALAVSGSFGTFLTLNSTTAQAVLASITNGVANATVLYTIYDSTGATQLATGTLYFDAESTN